MGGPSTDEPPDKVQSAARSTSSSSKRRDDDGRKRSKRSYLLPPFHRFSRESYSGRGDDVESSGAVPDATSAAQPPAAPPPDHTQAAGEKHSTVGNVVEGDKPAPTSILSKAKAKCTRFVIHGKNALLHSWVNVLLVFVPVGMAVNYANMSPSIIFAMNAVAIIPLAGLLSHATESVADRLGDTWGALLNVSFGNAVELIIFIIALAKSEIRIVQASILGSILANLLLILGMAFFLGGLRFQEQVYNSTVTQMSACLLSLSVMSLLLPTAFHASWADSSNATTATLQVSRGTSVILLVIYVLYLLFQLKSHSYLYESMPQHIIDEESHPGILHDVLNSSSSSSSSDSSSDSDTDASSASGNTAKRAFRRFRRKRRKSSVSSKDTPSVPSIVSSPLHDSESFRPASSRRTSFLHPVLSGDEADEADVENDRIGGSTTVRDFEKQNGPASPPPERRHKRRHRKRRHHHRQRPGSKGQSDAGEPVSAQPAPNNSSVPSLVQTDRKVGFLEDAEEHAENEKRIEDSRNRIRNPFNMPTRPAVKKTLSSAIPTVFQTLPSHSSGLMAPQKVVSPVRVPMGPRRVRSLPDRMNAFPALAATQSNTVQPSPAHPAVIREEVDDSDDEHEGLKMSRTAAVVLLLISTALVALCAEYMVDAIPEMTANSSAVSQTFIGLIILPIVGNAAEHVTAVTVAAKNKMDLAIGVAVGSSIQIALFVTPLVVLLGWIMQKDMSLYFNLFETVALFVTAFVVNFLVLDGRSNYLEGALLMGSYVIIAVAAFFYPDVKDQSALGGNGTE